MAVKRSLLFMLMLCLAMAGFLTHNPVSGISKAIAQEPTIQEVDTAISEAEVLIEQFKALAPEEEGDIEDAIEEIEKARLQRDSGEYDDALDQAMDCIEELKEELNKILSSTDE